MLTSTPKLSQGAKFAARSVDQPHRLERVFMLVASVRARDVRDRLVTECRFLARDAGDTP